MNDLVFGNSQVYRDGKGNMVFEDPYKFGTICYLDATEMVVTFHSREQIPKRDWVLIGSNEPSSLAKPVKKTGHYTPANKKHQNGKFRAAKEPKKYKSSKR